MFKINFKNMLKITLRKKSLAGYLFMVFLIVAVGVISVLQSQSLEKKVNYLANEVSAKVKLADEFSFEILSMRIAVEKYIYRNKETDNTAAEENITRVIHILERAEKEITKSHELKILQQIKSLTSEYITKYRNVVIRYRAINENKSSLKELGTQIIEKSDEMQDISEKIPNLIPKIMSAITESEQYMAFYDHRHYQSADKILKDLLNKLNSLQTDTIEELIFSVEDYTDDLQGLFLVTQKIEEEVKETLLPLAPEITSLAKKIYTAGWNEMDQAREEVETKVSSTGKWIFFIVTFAILTGLYVGWVSANRVIDPISEMISGIMNIADGDLDTQINIKTRDELGELAQAVNLMIVKLSGMVGESIVISQGVADAAIKHAKSLEATSSSLDQMSSMTRQNADNSGHADRLMKEAEQVVYKAEYSMNELIASMKKIIKASEESSKIIKTIDEIAFQTNLLALNAAVEAARAGEAGVGFAVVAGEVRNLAMQTATAAKNTASLLEGTIQTVNDVATLVTKTGKSFSEVTSTFSHMSQLIEEISVASGEQAQGIEQISRSVTEIDKVSQENVSNSERLRKIMSIFRIG